MRQFAGKLKKVIFLSLMLLTSATSFSQTLLANGDFEEENICTEYKVNCSPEAWVTNKDGFSTYMNDSSSAYHGKRYLAIEIGHTTKIYQRTFYRSRLVCGLRKDNRYRLEFYVRSPYPVLDSMGIIFSSFDFLLSKKKLQNLIPTMFIRPAVGVFTADSIWQKVAIDYLATGRESFLTIANFCRRDIRGEKSNAAGGHFFVFMDSISLTPLDDHERLCSEAQVNQQAIYEQDERHEFLRQKIRQNNDDPPMVVIPPMKMLLIDTLVLPDMLFASGKAALQSGSYKVLEDFFGKLAGKKIDSIVVEGHTDNTGTLSANEKLSAERARAIRDIIKLEPGLSKLTFITRGWADKRPVTTNTTASGRQRNRRVELFVYAAE
ncbi:MAG: OmpA family protein [Chitinophagaceae bacterium]|nr:OmpA family protein [Chitinophagaceae bacterium]